MHDDARLARLARLDFVEFLRHLARTSGRRGRIEERDGLLCYATGTEFPVTCNGAVRLDPALPAGETVERADAWFGALGRGYTLHVRDLDEDAELVEVATAAGLLALGGSPAMVCRAALDPVDPTLDLRWVGGGGRIEDALEISDRAYQSLGMPEGVILEMSTDLAHLAEPHVHTVVAHLDGAPVATAQVLLSHGIAGVYYVGTLEAARGRGLAEAVTRAVTNRGFELGAEFASLQASTMGEAIYRRMGYEELERYRSLVRFV